MDVITGIDNASTVILAEDSTLVANEVCPASLQIETASSATRHTPTTLSTGVSRLLDIPEDSATVYNAEIISPMGLARVRSTMAENATAQSVANSGFTSFKTRMMMQMAMASAETVMMLTAQTMFLRW